MEVWHLLVFRRRWHSSARNRCGDIDSPSNPANLKVLTFSFCASNPFPATITQLLSSLKLTTLKFPKWTTAAVSFPATASTEWPNGSAPILPLRSSLPWNVALASTSVQLIRMKTRSPMITLLCSPTLFLVLALMKSMQTPSLIPQILLLDD